MTSRSFPVCCGISLLTDFGNTSTAIDSTPYTKEDVAKFLDNQAARDKYDFQAFRLVTLNGEQFAKIGDVFLEKGWEIVAEAPHPGHGTTIYILVYHIQKHKSNGTSVDNS